VVAAVACTQAASAATAPWKTITVARHAGPISAVMTVQRQAHGDGFFSFRKLRLVVRANGKTVVDRMLCGELRCSPGSHHSLAVQNVWGGSLPEAVMSVYTGGAHCCFETLIALVDGPYRGRLLDHNWGDPGYKGTRHDGVYEFLTADDRFAYEFTSFAASGLPVRVLTIDPSAKIADITPLRLDLVRSDAKQWWHAYVQFRGKPDGDIRGVLAAWCADEYRLGEGAACQAELQTALRKGWLGKPGDLWPAGARYIAAVDRDLQKWGYSS
jgi:hypothetical protein